jgi:hypothetical protein
MVNQKLGKYSSMNKSLLRNFGEIFGFFFAVFQFIVAAHYEICEYFTTVPHTRGAP